MKKNKDKKEKITFLKKRLFMAGFDLPLSSLIKILIKVTIIVMILISLILSYWFFVKSAFLLSYYFILLGVTLTLGTILMHILIWIIFFFFIDIKIFNRSRKIEKVLPDFLQISAENIRAGMGIEKALWYAVRPNFGVLAKEIEVVAKEVMSGKELVLALQEFITRYDSNILKRSINLLIEGIKSGGEIGELLNKIAENIQETDIMKKDMSANVSTYAIFISFATIVAAPILFALSGQLLNIVTQIFASINLNSSSSSKMPISFSGVGLSYADYMIFAIVTLSISSFFSAIIVATIKKGNAKYGLKQIPIYIAVSILIFLFLSKVMGGLFANMI